MRHPFYCKKCNDPEPRYDLDHRCEVCLSKVLAKSQKNKENHEDADDSLR